MPIPEFNDYGVLPPGIHDCTIEEIGERLRGSSPRSHRSKMVDDLARYVGELRKAGVAQYMLVDGSFVTAKENPNDVDIILVASESYDVSQRLRPDRYNSISRKRLARRFPFDVFFVVDGSRQITELTTYFQQIRRHEELLKGMLRILL